MRIEDIHFKYGDKKVMDGFTMQLPETGIVCLYGPSGCGKTTLVRILAGLETPESGEIIGIAPSEVTVLFQEDRLLPWLDAASNIRSALNSKIGPDPADELLRSVGLENEGGRYPGQLSGGMRRRVALARALGRKCRLLILDEPFKGVDNETRSGLYPLVKAQAKKKPVIFITHDEDEAWGLSDYLVRLKGIPLEIVETVSLGRSE